MRFGRNRPVAVGPHLKFRDYLVTAFTPPPGPYGYGVKATTALAQMYLNADEGDCVIASAMKVRGVTTGNASGVPVIYTDTQVNQDYSAIGGYVPGDPSTDLGCDEVTALNYWVQTGFPDGAKFSGWASIDATNPTEVQTALYLFENLILTMELPNAYVNPMPSASGFVWGVAGAPNPRQGHSIMAFDGIGGTLQVATWGMTGTMTAAAIAEYCTMRAGGGLYVAVDPAMVAKASAKAPNGMDWASLVADFDSLFGGTVPAPLAPPTPPAPIPIPTPPSPTPPPSQQVVGTVTVSAGIPTDARVLVAREGNFPIVVTSSTGQTKIPSGKYDLVPA